VIILNNRQKRRTEKLIEAREELVLVKEAIKSIVGGAQQYSMGSRSVSKASLNTLYKRQKELEDIIDGLSGGSGRFKRVIPIDR